MPEIICFAKRGGWFEKFAPGSPPRHDAQLRLVNAQQAHLRGVVGMSLCTCHIFCSLVFCSHLHNSSVGNNGKRCRGCTLGCIGCARRVLRQGADIQLPLRWHWELIRAELQALGRAAHSSSPFCAGMQALVRAAHPSSLCKRWGGLHSSTTGALWRGGGRALLCRCGRWWRARETCSQVGRVVS